MGQGVEAIAGADGGYALFGMLQVVQDTFTFLVQNPFIYRYVIHVFKQSPEGGRRISSKVGKLLHILYFVIILHDEIMETFGIGTDGVEECTDLGQRIIACENVNQLLAFDVDVFAAGRRLFPQILGKVFQQIFQLWNSCQGSVGQGGFGTVEYFLIALLAKRGELGEPVNNVFHIGKGQQFHCGADGLQYDLVAVQSGSRILCAVYEQVTFQHEDHAVLCAFFGREMLPLRELVIHQHSF